MFLGPTLNMNSPTIPAPKMTAMGWALQRLTSTALTTAMMTAAGSIPDNPEVPTCLKAASAMNKADEAINPPPLGERQAAFRSLEDAPEICPGLWTQPQPGSGTAVHARSRH